MVNKYEAALTALAFGDSPSNLRKTFGSGTVSKCYSIALYGYDSWKNKQNQISKEYRKTGKEKQRHSEYQQLTRTEAIKKLGNKCVSCGYNGNIHALEIDHIVPLHDINKNRKQEKEYGITFYRKIINGIKDNTELQVLCANCHRIKTFEELKYVGGEKG